MICDQVRSNRIRSIGVLHVTTLQHKNSCLDSLAAICGGTIHGSHY